MIKIQKTVETFISVNDIIENLDAFHRPDLILLKKAISKNIEDATPAIRVETLFDEQKLEIVKELFDKLTLDKLQDIRENYVK